MAASELPQLEQIALANVRQHEVLFVADANLAETEAIGPVGDRVHLHVGDVARRNAGHFGRQGHDRVSGPFVRRNVGSTQRLNSGSARRAAASAGVAFELFVSRRSEGRNGAIDLFTRQRRRTILRVHPFGIDVLTEHVGRHRANENLDACFVLVVAPSVAVVHTQDASR